MEVSVRKRANNFFKNPFGTSKSTTRQGPLYYLIQIYTEYLQKNYFTSKNFLYTSTLSVSKFYFSSLGDCLTSALIKKNCLPFVFQNHVINYRNTRDFPSIYFFESDFFHLLIYLEYQPWLEFQCILVSQNIILTESISLFDFRGYNSDILIFICTLNRQNVVIAVKI